MRTAEAEATKAAKDLERFTPLAASGTASQQQLDAARAAAHTTSAQADAARNQLRLVREGARPQEIAAARAAVNTARQALAGAQASARDLVLTSPLAGSVLSRHSEPGEVLAPGISGMTLGDISRPYVRIYVDEFAFPHVHIGDTALVYPGRAAPTTVSRHGGVRERQSGVHAASCAHARRARGSDVRRQGAAW